MPRAKTLALVETSQEETQAPPQEVASSDVLATLAALEARLSRLEQMAHVEHQMELGRAELQAIGRALSPHMQEQALEAVCKHLGIAPPIARGDGS